MSSSAEGTIFRYSIKQIENHPRARRSVRIFAFPRDTISPHERLRFRLNSRFGHPRLHSRSPALCRRSRHSLDHHPCFLALLVTGVEILISHPRFYWGETGNALTPPLFKLPIPASRAPCPPATATCFPTRTAGAAISTSNPPGCWYSPAYSIYVSAWLQAISGGTLLPARAESVERFESPTSAPARPSAAEDASSYNVVQRLTYLVVIFVLFPLVIWTGLAMSPAVASAIPAAVTILGGQQSARTLHFFVSVFLVLFLVVHVAMVALAGFRNRMRRDDHRRAAQARGAPMSKVSRRKLITTGLPLTAGASGLAVAAQPCAALWTHPARHRRHLRSRRDPDLCGAALADSPLFAREFAPSQISKAPFANEVAPLDEAFKRLQAGGFADWRLAVDGMVARPASFSLAELKAFPLRSQITHLACEEGWSYIAEWIGVPLSHVLERRRESFPRLATSSTSRSSPTGGKASTWPMPCTRRLSSPTV